MTTNNTNNTGIMHAVIKFGTRPLCGRRNAIMATEISAFRHDSHPCIRCSAKLAEMDARANKDYGPEDVEIAPRADLRAVYTQELPSP